MTSRINNLWDFLNQNDFWNYQGIRYQYDWCHILNSIFFCNGVFGSVLRNARGYENDYGLQCMWKHCLSHNDCSEYLCWYVEQYRLLFQRFCDACFPKTSPAIGEYISIKFVYEWDSYKIVISLIDIHISAWFFGRSGTAQNGYTVSSIKLEGQLCEQVSSFDGKT